MDTSATQPIFGFSEESDQTILHYEKYFGARHYGRLPGVVPNQKDVGFLTSTEAN